MTSNPSSLQQTQRKFEEGRKIAAALWEWRRVVGQTVAWCSASVLLRPFTGVALPQAMMRVYFDRVVRSLGIELMAEGVEKLAASSPAVIVCNHYSLLDVPCIGALLDFDYKWVSKREIFSIPFVGWHLRACGHLWIDRTRRNNARRLQREFHRTLTHGGSIVMFPEGRRSQDGALGPFARGAFDAAVRESVPVVPLVIEGTQHLLERGSLAFPRHEHKRVHIRVLDPVPVPSEGAPESRVNALRDRVREVMAATLEQLRASPEEPPSPSAAP